PAQVETDRNVMTRVVPSQVATGNIERVNWSVTMHASTVDAAHGARLSRQSRHHHQRTKNMPEAVIVATARSPIGRAFKGSLKDMRPDDLTTQVVQSALAKVPELDPQKIDDLMLGCGLPGGEQGFN